MSSRSHNSAASACSRGKDLEPIDEDNGSDVSTGLGERKPAVGIRHDGLTEEEHATAIEETDAVKRDVSVLRVDQDNGNNGNDDAEMRDGSGIDMTDNSNKNNDDGDGDVEGPTSVPEAFVTTVERLANLSSRVTNALKNDNLGFIRELFNELPYARESLENEYDLLRTALDGRDDAQVVSGRPSDALIRAVCSIGTVAVYVKDVQKAVLAVHTKLCNLARRSQADASQHPVSEGGTKRTRDQISTDEGLRLDRKTVGFLEPGTGCELGTPLALEYFNEKAEKKRRITSFDELGDKHKTVLESFNRLFQNVICGAKMVPAGKEKKNEKDRGGKGVDGSKKIPTAADYQRSLDEIAKRLSWSDQYLKSDQGLESDTTNDTQRTLYVPGPKAEELAHVQPFLLVFLQSLGQFLEHVESFPKEKSPTKSRVQRNRILPQIAAQPQGDGPPKKPGRPKRDVDKTIAANGQFIYLFRDDLLEIAPWVRIDQSPYSLLVEVTSQVLSTLAKQVAIGFNFASLGVDTKATGVILTPVYVKIIQLRLENMGRLEVKLVQYETNCHPLMTEKNFDMWLESSKDAVTKDIPEEWIRFRSQLYPKRVDGHTDVVPSGLVVLSNLMTSVST